MFKIVTRIVGAILTLILGWAVLCPILISAPSDLLVVFGIAMVIVIPFLVYWIVRPLSKEVNQYQKEQRDKYFHY